MRGFPLAAVAAVVLACPASAQTADELVQRLKDREAAVRKAAADALVAVGPKGVPALADATTLPDEAGRIAAVEALARCGAAAKPAVPALAAALKDRSVEVRIQAATTLGKLGGDARAALPALAEAAKDTGNTWPLISATLPLGVAEAAVAASLKIDPDSAADLAKSALPALTEALKSKNAAEVMAAGAALAELGPHARPAVPALREARKSANEFVRGDIDRALRAAGEDVDNLLGDTIKDATAPKARRVEALNKLALQEKVGDGDLAALKVALKDPEPEVRAAAAAAAGELGPKARATVPALLALLGDTEIDQARARTRVGEVDVVATALARMRDDALPGLLDVFKDRAAKPVVRWDAVKATGLMGRRARSALPQLEAGMGDDRLLIAVESAYAYVRAGGDPAKAVPVLKVGLKHDSPFAVWRTAYTVERLGPKVKDLVPQLVPLLEHKEREIRITAAHALSTMGPAAAPGVPGIARLLKTDDRRQRLQAAEALSRLGPDAAPAAPVLVECLGDIDAISLGHVLETLGNIGPAAKDAVPVLLGMLKKDTGLHIEDVVDVLGQIGPDAKAAVPQIVALLDARSWFTRARAARALGRIGPAAADATLALKKLLEDESTRARVWAAFALARIGGDARTYVPMLVEWWNRDAGADELTSARLDLVRAFELLGADARPARDLLLEAALDPATLPGVRSHVAAALGQLGDDADVIVPKMTAVLERQLQGYKRSQTYVGALQTLALLGSKAKAAAPAVRKLLDDDEDEVADAAARALERIEGGR